MQKIRFYDEAQRILSAVLQIHISRPMIYHSHFNS